jgi:hypothetical protein
MGMSFKHLKGLFRLCPVSSNSISDATAKFVCAEDETNPPPEQEHKQKHDNRT